VPNGAVSDPGWQEKADRIAREQFAGDRQLLQSDLERVISKSIDAKYVAHLNARAHVIPVPQYKGSTVGYHYLVRNLAAATGFAVKLFLDPDRPYGKDLHRCQWDDCKSFFLTSDAQQAKEKATGERSGKRRTKFCSDPCMYKKRDRKRFEPRKKSEA
jgi:hypothetical protein